MARETKKNQTFSCNYSQTLFCFTSLQSVQSVISNLLISHIELRSDESPDILAHSHQRSVDKVVVPLGDVLSAYQAHYLQVGTCDFASYLDKLLPVFATFIFFFYYNHTSDIKVRVEVIDLVLTYFMNLSQSLLSMMFLLSD